MRNLMEGKKPLFFISIYVSDVITFLLSWYLTLLMLYTNSDNLLDFHLRIALFSLLILIVNYTAFGLYDEKRKMFDETQFMSIFYSFAITYALMVVFMILFSVEFGLLICSVAFVLSLILTTTGRLVLYKILYMFRRAGHDLKKVIFYGKDNEELIQRIKENVSLGYEFIGTATNLKELQQDIDKADVVFITEQRITDELMDIIMQNNAVNWKIVPSAFNLVMDRISFDEFKDYPIINIQSVTISKSYLQVKRIFDIVVSGISLVLLSPLFLLIAIIIKLTMPGPIFYKHERLGVNLEPFYLYKFRTMIVGADKIKAKLANEVDALFKMRNDPRVTKFGNFLRRTCLDELPQLINIFKGEMSIVGPRPHLESELKYYKAWRRARFLAKPGLTGMWQVSGRHELNFDKAVLYDIYYVKHMSLVLDMSIILKTIPSIIFSRGRY